MDSNRRNFIKLTSLASASLLPVVSSLAQVLGKKDDEISSLLNGNFDSNLEFHIIDNNLLNLHFYFINVEKKGKNYLIPKKEGNSFMIVRLPQMHVSEKGFWEDDWNSDLHPEKRYPDATLSGYSYLAFQLWPNDTKKKELEFTLDNLLNWNDEINFDLITLIEWFKLKESKKEQFEFVDYSKEEEICKTFAKRKMFKKADLLTKIYQSEVYEPTSSVYLKYKSIIKKLLDSNLPDGDSNGNFIPITLLEIPQSLLLVPIYRDSNGDLSKTKKGFWSNKFVNQSGPPAGSRKYEIWNNTFFYKNPEKKKQKIEGDEKTFEVTAPSFRAVGVISEEFKCLKNAIECFKECEAQKEANYLPSLLDKTELAFITQYASQNTKFNFTQKDFDIKEMNGLFFTGLGVITHLKYYNVDKCPVDKGIDLIEYEHIITQGRDIFIRVARLGYNSKTGQRYKHVIEGKRKIETDDHNKFTTPLASFIELKQYCECIDKQISYTNPEVLDSKWKEQFNVISGPPKNSILSPAVFKIDYKRSSFKELTIIEKKRIPIRCLYEDAVIENDVCKLQCLPWFWPTKEDSTKEGMKGIEIPYNDYLLCEYDSKDWENKSIKAKTPFVFLRATYVAGNKFDDVYADYFKGDFFAKTKPDDVLIRDYNLIERRKTYYNNQNIAYTPSPQKVLKNTLHDLLKQQKLPIIKDSQDSINEEIIRINEKLNSLDESKSKTNIIETEFIEHYFNIKNIKAELASGKYIGEINYAVFPQVLRTKVFLDHVKDLTQQKIPSVVQYHDDYIQYVFKDYKQTPTELEGNGAKLILRITDVFEARKEEAANNTYQTISNALQESKDKLGNLVTPDILPDTVSLEKLGITAPPNIKDSIKKGRTVLNNEKKGIQEIASFNPRELLRGKLSDVCGLDLTAILDELIPADSKLNQTPLFEINKTINKITNEFTNSQVYAEIKKEIDFVRDEIQKLEDTYKSIEKTIKDQEQELNKNIKRLSNFIPNTDELNNLIKDTFEKYTIKDFDLSLKELPFEETIEKVKAVRSSVESYLNNEKKLLDEEYSAKKNELESYFKDLKDTATNQLLIPAELQYIDSFVSNLKSYYKTGFDFTEKIDLLFKSCLPAELKILQDVYYKTENGKMTWELTDKANGLPLQVCKVTFKNNIPSNIGFVQYQQLIENLQKLIVKNIEGNTVQAAAAKEIQKYLNTELNKKITLTGGEEKNISALFLEAVQQYQNDSKVGLTALRKTIDTWRTRATYLISTSSDSIVQANITKVQNFVVNLMQYVDFLKKSDPYFYYSELERLKKEITDTKGRFLNDFYGLYLTLEDVVNTKYAEFIAEHKKYLTLIDQLEAVKEELQKAIDAIRPNIPATLEFYNKKLAEYNKKLQEYNAIKNGFSKLKSTIITDLKTKATSIARDYINGLQDNAEIKKVFETIYSVKEGSLGLVESIKAEKIKYEDALKKYIDFIKAEGSKATEGITNAIETYIEKYQDEIDKINEARNLLRLLTSIKQQDLTYNWNTTSFRDINLGVVSFKKFSNPDTTLKVNVKATTHFTPGKFPPSIEKVVTYSENRFTNFGVSFFNSLTVGFNEVSFITGSDHSTHFDIKIKDVQFGGALSFVQTFEAWLKTMGKGLILQLRNDHVALGYSLPIPNIQTPAFSFFNLSLNLDLRIHFDKRPMRIGFSLARPDSKFGIAAGIYAGFGFFGIVADTKKGIVEIDCALEAGAWSGIRMGPIHGEVKLAFGFRYTKNEQGVRLEGYIVAEGRLSVWILEVSARIYLGVVSENSYVEGVCTVTYSVKVGLISKSFSGSFYKKIAGAERQNQSEDTPALIAFGNNLPGIKIKESHYLNKPLHDVLVNFSHGKDKLEEWEEETDKEQEIIETHYVSEENWKKFINIF